MLIKQIIALYYKSNLSPDSNSDELNKVAYDFICSNKIIPNNFKNIFISSKDLQDQNGCKADLININIFLNTIIDMVYGVPLPYKSTNKSPIDKKLLFMNKKIKPDKWIHSVLFENLNEKQ